MRDLARPAFVVTLLSVAGQLVGLATQVVIAGAFGARADMDAFLAATTLPQYVVSVLLNALVVVFVPVFLECSVGTSEDEAWRLASSVTAWVGTALAVIALAGILFAEPLLRVTTPGLSDASLALATKLARISWPATAASGVASLLVGIYHARHRFAWPAAAPILGGVVNLLLVLAFAKSFGIRAVAMAAVVGVSVQAVLLMAPLLGPGRLRPTGLWWHPDLGRLLSLLWPLVLSGLLIRCTPVVDRYLASSLPEGAISHLGYAFKLVSLVTLFVSTGISTVIFPRMALKTASDNLAGLRDTVSAGLRVMWLGVAPLMTIGAVVAGALIATIFERGLFTSSDTDAVAVLLTVYLVSMIGGCLGSITGRALYALKDTRLVAAVGVVEAAAYVGYTSWLTFRFGAIGIAAGYVIYYTISIAWQFLALRIRMGGTDGRLTWSLVRTGALAVAAGIVALELRGFFDSPLAQLIVPGLAGGMAYLILQLFWGGDELRILAECFRPWASRPRPVVAGTR